jgi:hypothetical protein
LGAGDKSRSMSFRALRFVAGASAASACSETVTSSGIEISFNAECGWDEGIDGGIK